MAEPLEEVYPIVYLDAMMVKMRDNGHVQNQAIYVVLGVDREGQKEVLGLWVAQQEGAKFWLQVLTELKNRGVKRCIRRPRCSCASCIWCGRRCITQNHQFVGSKAELFAAMQIQALAQSPQSRFLGRTGRNSQPIGLPSELLCLRFCVVPVYRTESGPGLNYVLRTSISSAFSAMCAPGTGTNGFQFRPPPH
jgi:hypothetical protein